MKKINIGLTPLVVYQLIESYFSYPMATFRLKQHMLIFSETIIEAYESFFSEYDALKDFQQWYFLVSKEDCCQEMESVSDDFKTEIFSLLERLEHSIFIKHNEDIGERSIPFSVFSLDEINCPDANNELARQCIPTNFKLSRGSDKEKFCHWLRNMLFHESKISIIDRYIMQSGGGDILEQIYIPTFPCEAKVEVYFGEREKDDAEIKKIKRKYGDRIRLYICNSSDFHERYIIAPTFHIAIGCGLDEFNCSNNKARKQTTITVYGGSDKPEFPRPVRY